MTDPADSLLHYTCPRCQAKLSAQPEHAGTRRTCPSCEKTIKVPGSPTSAAATSGSRTVNNASGSAAQISLECNQCQRKLYASPKQVGQTITCPDCLESVVVPVPSTPTAPKPAKSPASGEKPTEPPSAPKRPENTAEKISPEDEPSADDENEFQLSDPVDRPSSEAPLHGKTFDLSPAQSTSSDPTANSPVEKPAMMQPEHDLEFDVKCQVCGTRQSARMDDVGKNIKCPDCFSQIPVREPQKSKLRERNKSWGDDDFSLGEPPPPPDHKLAQSRTKTSVARDHMRRAEAEARKQDDAKKDLVELGPWLRNCRFLIDMTTIPHWVKLSLLLTAWVTLLYYIVYLGSKQEVLFQFMRLASFILILPVTAAFLAFTCVSFLAIVKDTADGNDKIESWPAGLFMDWMFEAFYVVNSALLAALPGFLVAQLLMCAGVPSWIGIVPMLLATYTLFPVCLSCMLESESMVVPYSRPVLRTLTADRRNWLIFYGVTAALSLAMALISLSFLMGNVIINLFASALVVPLGMIYFRALGLLLWHCRETLAEEEEES